MNEGAEKVRVPSATGTVQVSGRTADHSRGAFTVFPKNLGWRPKVKANEREEHAALLDRIINGHDYTELVLWDEAGCAGSAIGRG